MDRAPTLWAHSFPSFSLSHSLSRTETSLIDVGRGLSLCSRTRVAPGLQPLTSDCCCCCSFIVARKSFERGREGRCRKSLLLCGQRLREHMRAVPWLFMLDTGFAFSPLKTCNQIRGGRMKL
jgi:hypothetical protein